MRLNVLYGIGLIIILVGLWIAILRQVYWVGVSTYTLPPHVSSDHATLMYESLAGFDEFAKGHNLPYIIVGGLRVGSARNDPPGPLLWDDDIDVAMTESNWYRFVDILKNTDHVFEYNALGAFRSFVQLRLSKERNCKREKEFYLDVFRLDNAADGTVRNLDFPNTHFPASAVDAGSKACELWGRDFPCPNVTSNGEYTTANDKIIIWSHSSEAASPAYDAKDKRSRILMTPLMNGHIMSRIRGIPPPPDSCWVSKAKDSDRSN
jgi:hypothetical protein